MNPSELRVFVLGAVFVLGWFVVRWLKTWFGGPTAPDPWSREVANAMEEPGATPVCTHCQCPHEDTRWFCPECGRAVGQFISVMPPLCYLELGDPFREGASGSYRVSPLTLAGSVVFGFAGFVLVAPLFFLYPIYLWLFFNNLAHQKRATTMESLQ